MRNSPAGAICAKSKTCSACGAIKDMLTLDERTFRCDDCGYESGRDLNAALKFLME